MKKSILVSILTFIIVSIATYVNAYSTADYTVDIPEAFKEIRTGAFTEEDTGNGFEVKVGYNSETTGDPYTQQMLDKLVDEVFKAIETQKSEIEKQMIATYGSTISKEDIKKYVESFKCNSVDIKEITRCTKNNYKCFHLLTNCTMEDYSYYCDQYSIVSGNKLFVLTLSSTDKEDLEKEEMKQILDSFTITDYKEPKSGYSPILYGVIAGAVVGAVSGIVIAIKNKNKNKKNEKSEE